MIGVLKFSSPISSSVVQLVTPGSKWSRNYENELVCEVCGMTMMQRDSPGRTAHNLRVHAGSRHGIRDSEVAHESGRMKMCKNCFRCT